MFQHLAFFFLVIAAVALPCNPKILRLLADPHLSSDQLAGKISQLVRDRKKSIHIWDVREDPKRPMGVETYRRTINGRISYDVSDKQVTIDIYNINADPLTFYEIDANDKTTLKLMYAAKKILTLPDAGQTDVVRLRISQIVNARYLQNLIKLGFVLDGKNSVILEFKKDP